jgi:hypothetical protein
MMLRAEGTHLQKTVFEFNFQEVVFARLGRRSPLRPLLLVGEDIGQTAVHRLGGESQGLAAFLHRVQHLGIDLSKLIVQNPHTTFSFWSRRSIICPKSFGPHRYPQQFEEFSYFQ